VKARRTKTLGVRQHRIADAAALRAGRNVELIDVVVVQRQHCDDSPAILGHPGLALRHHLMDHEGANLLVGATVGR